MKRNKKHELNFVNLDYNENFKLVCLFSFEGYRRLDLKKLAAKNNEFKPVLEESIYKSAKVDLESNSIVFKNGLTISAQEAFVESTEIDMEKENNELKKIIYSYLKFLRKSKHITQEELAAMSGLKQSAIARLEAGTNDIQLSTLESYLKPLGYKVEIVKEK